MKKYRVYFTWTVSHSVEFEAENDADAEAKAIAVGDRLNDNDGTYVVDSLYWKVTRVGNA